MDERHPNGQPKYKELNPVLGENPSDAEIIGLKVGVALALYAIADWFPSVRRTALLTGNGIQIVVVANNFSIGMNVEIK
jgi:hypothetical protein